MDDFRVAMIFVVFGHYSDLDAMLSKRAIPDELEIVVVDNTDTELARPDIRERWRDQYGIRVLSPGNVGYAGAASHALKVDPTLALCDFLAWRILTWISVSSSW